MNRRHLRALLAVMVVFAVFVPLFYAFSYGKGDALERTIEEGGGTGGGSIWSAPFDYGDNPVHTFAAGVLGLAVVFLLAYALARASKRRRESDGPDARGAPPRP